MLVLSGGEYSAVAGCRSTRWPTTRSLSVTNPDKAEIENLVFFVSHAIDHKVCSRRRTVLQSFSQLDWPPSSNFHTADAKDVGEPPVCSLSINFSLLIGFPVPIAHDGVVSSRVI